MRKVKLELHNHKGEVVSEDELVISEGDKIIVSVNKDVTQKEFTEIHNIVDKFLTTDSKLLSLQNYVELKILKVK